MHAGHADQVATGNDTIDENCKQTKMIGGTGNDTYIIKNPYSVITGNSKGTGIVESYISYTLGSYLNNLTLEGTTNLVAKGNSFNDIITANSGNDTIYSNTGKDTLIGGTGNDAFYVNNTGDLIIENSNGANDTAITTVSYSLASNLENLTLNNSYIVKEIGNNLNNYLTV